MGVVKPAKLTPRMVAYWISDDTLEDVAPASYGSPDPDVESCEAVSTTNHVGCEVVRVPWELDEIELAHLARGGTLWLSTYGGLPPHQLEVQEP